MRLVPRFLTASTYGMTLRVLWEKRDKKYGNISVFYFCPPATLTNQLPGTGIGSRNTITTVNTRLSLIPARFSQKSPNSPGALTQEASFRMESKAQNCSWLSGAETTSIKERKRKFM